MKIREKFNSSFIVDFTGFMNEISKGVNAHPRKIDIYLQKLSGDFLKNLDFFITVSLDQLIDEKIISDANKGYWEDAFTKNSNILLKLILRAKDEPLSERYVKLLEQWVHTRQNINSIRSDVKCYRLFFECESNKGKEGIERLKRGEEVEPGNLIALANAFAYAISEKNLGQPLNLKIILEIHKRASTNVRGLKEEVVPGHLRLDDTGFGITLEQSQGLYEILTSKSYSIAYKIEGSRLKTLLKGESLITKLNELIREYNRDLERLRSNIQKLQRIVDFIQELIRVHPFGDGNGRSLGKILLNRELIKHGLVPAQLTENIFGTGDKCTIIKILINGMGRFLQKPTVDELLIFEKEIVQNMRRIIELEGRIEQNFSYANENESENINYEVREKLTVSLSAMLKEVQLEERPTKELHEKSIAELDESKLLYS
ncbi:Fic/DOC family [Legionella busanensis]|uniref:Fic/DOC family n=1 Tax=Legionella busanensis TaxID=190655 RepID=A0A378JJV5_9GAMM|nr:Fic family protein [Legionella busanensis]STX51454.1 Fic/DOC family [Legionella busanensis]